MKILSPILLVCSLVTVTSYSARADQNKAQKPSSHPAPTQGIETSQFVTEKQTYPLVSLFGGVNAGGIYLLNDESLTDTLHSGYSIGLGGTSDFHWPGFTFGLSLGWGNSKIFVEPAEEQTTTNPGIIEAIETSFGELVFSPRIHLPASLQIGPSVKLLFGSDTSFAATETSEPSLTTLLGAQALVQKKLANDVTWQFGVQGYTSVSLSERNITTLQAFINLGLPLNQAREQEIKTTTQLIKKQKVITEYRDHFFVSLGVVYFVTGKSDIPTYTREYLEQVGQYLQQHAGDWETFHITSHTDVRGSAELNERLSAERAKSLASVLVEAGVPENKIVVRSLASTDPVEASLQEVSLARNRRVEISISGKDGVKSLEEQLLYLKLRFRRIQAKCRLRVCS